MNTVRRRPRRVFKAAHMHEHSVDMGRSAFRNRLLLVSSLSELHDWEIALADPRKIVGLAHRDICERCAKVKEIRVNVEGIYSLARQKLSEIAK